MRIYVASSWRNKYQPEIVKHLRERNHEVYDFREPVDGKHGFSWSEVEPNWKSWDVYMFIRELYSSVNAYNGFTADFNAMKNADACVLVLPCGASAHSEAGWMKGAGKKVFVYIPKDEFKEAELMYKMFDFIVTNLKELDAVILHDE